MSYTTAAGRVNPPVLLAVWVQYIYPFVREDLDEKNRLLYPQEDDTLMIHSCYVLHSSAFDSCLAFCLAFCTLELRTIE